MNLKDYLYENRIKQVDVCRELNILPGTLGNIVRGMTCGPQMAKKISEWTGGKVSAESLMTKGVIHRRCVHCGSLIKQKK